MYFTLRRFGMDVAPGSGMTSVATAVCIIFAAQLSLLAQTSDGADRAVPASATDAQPESSPTPEGQQVREFLKDTFSPLSLVSSAASAGIGQWRDAPRQYGQGAEGYGRRYASSYAQHLVNATLMFGGSNIFREDNRYVPSGQSGVGTRIKYALKSKFLTRHNGARRIRVAHHALAGTS
jgi:hypothetical protein